jgi:hypothetical protein
MNQTTGVAVLLNGPFILSWIERERESKQALNPTLMHVIPLILPHQNSINTPPSGTLDGLK